MVKKEIKLVDYVGQYIENGKIYGNCMINGDYRKSNQAYSRLKNIFKIARTKSVQEVEEFYGMLLLQIKLEIAKKDLKQILNCFYKNGIMVILNY